MKKLILFIASALLALSFSVYADHRVEMEFCHAAPNPNNDDAELYLPGCNRSNVNIDIIEAADGTLRAYGSVEMLKHYRIGKGTMPNYLVAQEGWVLNAIGSDEDINLFPDHQVFNNTACTLVTSNYQANNNSDDQNQTEYTTNKWDMSVKYVGVNAKGTHDTFSVEYFCRDGNS